MRTRGRGYKGPCGRPQASIFYHAYINYVFSIASYGCELDMEQEDATESGCTGDVVIQKDTEDKFQGQDKK